MKNPTIVSFKDLGNDFLIASEKNPMERKSSHENRIEQIQREITEKSHKLQKISLESIVDTLLELFEKSGFTFNNLHVLDKNGKALPNGKELISDISTYLWIQAQQHTKSDYLEKLLAILPANLRNKIRTMGKFNIKCS